MMTHPSHAVRLRSARRPGFRFHLLGDRHPYVPIVPHGLAPAIAARAKVVRDRADRVTDAELDAAAELPKSLWLGPHYTPAMADGYRRAREARPRAPGPDPALLRDLAAHVADLAAEGGPLTRSALARRSGWGKDALLRLLRTRPDWTTALGLDPDPNASRGRVVRAHSLAVFRAAAASIRARGEAVTIAGLAREAGRHEGYLRECLARHGSLAAHRDELIDGDGRDRGIRRGDTA